MADKTGIEWTDATWTPIRARNKATGKVGWHCEHASPGCVNCYSETFNAKRLGTGLPFKPGHRADVEHFLDEAMLTQPLRWRKPRMVFVCSMTDLFGDWVSDEWIDRVFAVMALAPQHTFQVLTKRAERMREYCRRLDDRGRHPSMTDAALMAATGRWNTPPIDLRTWPLPNVWLGVSAEDQKRADERVPLLLQTPAAVRWVSAEPLLGPINFDRITRKMDVSPWNSWTESALHGCVTPWFQGQSLASMAGAHERLDWIVAGGESGPGARPMENEWAEAIVAQCRAAGVPVFVKQITGPGGRAVKDFERFPRSLQIREWPHAA